jgi:hypothetical protein
MGPDPHLIPPGNQQTQALQPRVYPVIKQRPQGRTQRSGTVAGSPMEADQAPQGPPKEATMPTDTVRKAEEALVHAPDTPTGV